MDEFRAKIKEYLELIDSSFFYYVKSSDCQDDRLDFAIDEIADRVMLYLNIDTIPERLKRIIANIVYTNLKRCKNAYEKTKECTTGIDRAVTSISDNGQSITYANEITRYFTTASDEEIFTGFTALLSRYRRVKVVYPKHNENGNS